MEGLFLRRAAGNGNAPFAPAYPPDLHNIEHCEQYARRGVNLAKEPVVGVGTGCRRQATVRFGAILATLRADLGDRLHSFGLKIKGLELSHEQIASSDSLAWSYNARRKPPLPECVGTHQACNNCLIYALRWRKKVTDLVGMEEPVAPPDEVPIQKELF